ncbi:MAG TPA: response regulator, partial [Ramlibacter sp.]|nr:response regulator [Ramlibacter sp.]
WRGRLAIVLALSVVGFALAAIYALLGAPDVALVDYHLGDPVDGLQLAAALRQRYPGTGVVMVTAESGGPARERLAEAGLPVLEKPVSPHELRLTLALFRAAGA